MGKSEREQIHEAEIIVCKILNNEGLIAADRAHEFYEFCVSAAKKIKADFPSLRSANHSGNSYATPGDIVLDLPGREHFIELKFIHGEGTGTLANISADAFSNYGIFSAPSHSDFLAAKGHYSWVLDLLNKYEDFPIQLKEKRSQTSIHQRADLLKGHLEVGSRNVENVVDEILSDGRQIARKRKAAEIIKRIIEKDREEKLEYLRLLKDSKLDKGALRRFALLLLTGSHTGAMITEGMAKPLEELLTQDNYDIYYINKKTGDVRRENMAAIKELAACEFDVRISEGLVSIVVFGNCADAMRDVLRISVHWKNKFQGIQTPCLNIFKC